jgi:hypothetical protein
MTETEQQKESKKYIESKVSSWTNAFKSDIKVKNNRYHYFLQFNESIGWDWMEDQINKANRNIRTNIELYKIIPHDFESGSMIVEVRETERREKIDEKQRGLDSFSS